LIALVHDPQHSVPCYPVILRLKKTRRKGDDVRPRSYTLSFEIIASFKLQENKVKFIALC